MSFLPSETLFVVSKLITSLLYFFSADAGLFKEAFKSAQENNKSLLSSGDAAPTPVESDAPVSADVNTDSTGAPVTKGKESAPSAEVEAEAAPPAYKDEGVVPPPEKTEVVQGEEVKEPTSEVKFHFCSLRVLILQLTWNILPIVVCIATFGS